MGDNAAMPRSVCRRVFVLAVLVLWMAPAAGALALSFHLVLDHHGGGPVGQGPPDEDELVLATLHGHHHAELTSEHEHTAALSKSPTVRRAPKVVGLVAGASNAIPASVPGDTTDTRLLRAPPDLLFDTHCSLLL
jgi:hypothetical protein